MLFSCSSLPLDLAAASTARSARTPAGDRARRRRGRRRGGRRRRHRHAVRQGDRVGDPPAGDARRDHLDPVAGLRAHRGVLLLRPGRRLHRLLPLESKWPLVLHHPVAASSSSFLITPNVGLMIWTLVVFGISLFILVEARVPAHRRGARPRARRRSRSRSTRAERTRKEADELLAEYRERLARRASRPRRSSTARARPATAHEREARTEAQARARADARADPPRHRGRDAAARSTRSAARSPT